MRIRPVALALLLALAFGVMTAAYPCAAAAPHRFPPAAARPSCHHVMPHRPPPPATPGKHRGCCDPPPGAPQVCQMACPALAVLGLPAALPVLERRMAA